MSTCLLLSTGLPHALAKHVPRLPHPPIESRNVLIYTLLIYKVTSLVTAFCLFWLSAIYLFTGLQCFAIVILQINISFSITHIMQTKCELYWPETENVPKSYHDLTVTLTDTEKTADFIIRTFEVRRVTGADAPEGEGEELRHVKQFHYTTWPDHGVPTRTSPIIAFRRKLRSFDESHPGPVIIHCRYAAVTQFTTAFTRIFSACLSFCIILLRTRVVSREFA